MQRGSTLQDDEFSRIRGGLDWSDMLVLQQQQAEEYPLQAQGLIADATRPTQDFRRVACSIDVKRDTVHRSSARTPSAYFHLDDYSPTKNRPRYLTNASIDSRKAPLNDKSSMKTKLKQNPLYISILGKKPICREFYDGTN